MQTITAVCIAVWQHETPMWGLGYFVKFTKKRVFKKKLILKVKCGGKVLFCYPDLKQVSFYTATR